MDELAIRRRSSGDSEDFVEKLSKFEFMSHSRQSPVTSDPQKWYYRDGIRSPSTTRDKTSPDETTDNYLFVDGGIINGATNHSQHGRSVNSPPAVPPKPNDICKQAVNCFVTSSFSYSSSSPHGADVISRSMVSPKVISVTKLEPFISPKVFAPQPATTNLPASFVFNADRMAHHNEGFNQAQLKASALNEYEEAQLELKRQKVMRERVFEQQMEKQEKQRLEEILSLCAEYEANNQSEQQVDTARFNVNGDRFGAAILPKSSPTSPLVSRKFSDFMNGNCQTGPNPYMNRIKTNGSLPRDARLLPDGSGSKSPTSPRPVPFIGPLTASYDNLEDFFFCQNLPTPPPTPIEVNACLAAANKPVQSPRTKIKTVAMKGNGSPQKSPDASPTYEDVNMNKLVLNANQNKGCRQYPVTQQSFVHSDSLVIENPGAKLTQRQLFLSPNSEFSQVSPSRGNKMHSPVELNKGMLRSHLSGEIEGLKSKISDLINQEEESVRELEMEYALLEGEYQERLSEMKADQDRLVELETNETEFTRDAEWTRQKELSRIDLAGKRLFELEKNLRDMATLLQASSVCSKDNRELQERFKHQQEQLETERRAFEDLEFHQLENETRREEEREHILRQHNELLTSFASKQMTLEELDAQKREIINQVRFESQKLESERHGIMERAKQKKSNLDQLVHGMEVSADGSCVKCPSLDSSSQSSSDNEGNDNASGSVIDNSYFAAAGHCKTKTEDSHAGKKALCSGIKESRNRSDNNANRLSDESAKCSCSDGESRSSPYSCTSGDELDKSSVRRRPRKAAPERWSCSEEDAKRNSNGSSCDDDKSSLAQSTPSSDKENGDTTGRDDETTTEDGGSCRRPTSNVSDDSSTANGDDSKKNKFKQQRPLTRYLPVRSTERFDLRQHVESAGHQIELCSHVSLTAFTCKGYLYKLGSKFKTWNKRWFVFDRRHKVLVYYSDRSESKPRGGVYFQHIEEVYVDHGMHKLKKPPSAHKQNTTFCVKTFDRTFILVAPNPESMRIWVDVIFTGAEGYQEFQSEVAEGVQ